MLAEEEVPSSGPMSSFTPGDSVRVAVAITPSASVLVFTPYSKHVYVPLAPLQARVFEALVLLGPATTVIAVKSDGE